MSRIVTHNGSTSQLIPSGYTSGGTYTFTWRNPSNAYYNADHSNNTYARLTLASNRNSQRVSVTYLNFDKTPLNSIPDGANIDSVESNIKYYISSTGYVTAFSAQLYTNTTAKGSALTDRPTSATKYALTTGNWTTSELQNIRLYISATHNLSTSNAHVYLNGADITVNYSWDETFYEFTCSSSVQGVGMTSGETTSGGSFTATITGISDISSVVIKDNGTDVTNTFTKSGNNYVKSYSNVNADHAITIEEYKKSYVKTNGAFTESSMLYRKNNSSWSSVRFIKVWTNVNGTWLTGQTTSRVSGFVTRTYALNNCVANLDGINSYANRYIDSETGNYVYPFDHVYSTPTIMRGYDIAADGQSFTFNGTSSYMRPGASTSFDNYLYTGYTIEALFEVSSLPSTNGGAFTLFVGRNSKQTIALYCYYNSGAYYFIKSSGTSSKMLVLSSISLNEKHYIAANANGWMFDGVYYPDSESTAGTNSLSTNDILNVSDTWACASIGMRFKEGRNPDAFNGKLYALRIHSTRLAENEMRKNMTCDLERFS